MKHNDWAVVITIADPAAFRRLCVETVRLRGGWPSPAPAAFRRLCVETELLIDEAEQLPTRPAAFRRLCVETERDVIINIVYGQPPSGGCVLKRLRVGG